MDDTLAILFGSPAKAKLVKLFVFNPAWQLSREEVMSRAKINQGEARRSLQHLVKMDLIKERKIWVEGSTRKKRVTGYNLNPEFIHLEPLRQFLLAIASISDKEIVSRLSRAGRIRLVVTAGVFLHDWDGRVDLLIVGDNLKVSTAETAIKSMEAEMGRELQYVIFETDDFRYRLGLYDKLIRDILDFSHKVVVDKIGLSTPLKVV